MGLGSGAGRLYASPGIRGAPGDAEELTVPRRRAGGGLVPRPRAAFVIAVLALVLVLGAATVAALRPRDEPAPHLPTGVVDPKVGVHTRLADEVEPAKIDRTLDMVADMGATWIVELFPWSYTEPEPGEYSFSHADLVVDAAARRNLRVVARLDIVPSWARPADTSSRYLAPERYPEYAAYVGAFVRHFGDRVPYVVIWNEPNLSFEWGFQPPSPRQYARLLELSSAAAKRADPRVHVVTAGLAPTVENSPNAMDDLAYLQGLYDAGAGPYFDVLGAHAYGLTESPLEAPAPDRVNFQRVTLEHGVMGRNGDGDKQVLITETGWNDAPRWTHAVRPAQRVAYTLDAYRLASSWPWLLATNVFEFRLPVREDDVNDYFTFVQQDFTPRAVYRAVQRYAHGLPDAPVASS